MAASTGITTIFKFPARYFFGNRAIFPELLITACIFLMSASPQKEMYLVQRGSIRFYSDAPMESIHGVSQKLKGVINTANRTFAFSVNNHTITGFNSQLQQEHFYENYIEADKYPNSSFEGKIIEQIDFSRNGEYTVRAKGLLNIHGVAKERIIKSSLQVKNGTLFIRSRFNVLLEEHNIKIPRIVFQKIAKEITIDVYAEFKRSDTDVK